MLSKKTIRDIEIAGKTVIIREDFNVPLNEHGVITDDYRIRQALPTIEHARGMGAKVVIIAHMGRPEGKNDPNLSLMPVATKLSELMHLPVKFATDCVGKSAGSVVKSLQPGEIALLENLRFNLGEEANDEKFAKDLASLGDVFVQDGFGVSYRKHASTDAICKFLPSVAGFLLQKEVDTISAITDEPKRPLAVIIGGAKIADKIGLIEKFIDKADYVAVVGAVANTFLAAEGLKVGKSLVDEDYLSVAEGILEKALDKMQHQKFTFYLPHDVVVAQSADSQAQTRVVDIGNHTWADISAYPKQPNKSFYTIMPEEIILDIGPMTAAAISGALKLSETVMFNGMAGVTEVRGLHGAADPFAHGTNMILEALIGERAGEKDNPFSIVAGGDTVAYAESIPNYRDKIGFLSTGGGASLELIAGQPMPGIDNLLEK
jgi:3-phosphoglycerate kinase